MSNWLKCTNRSYLDGPQENRPAVTGRCFVYGRSRTQRPGSPAFLELSRSRRAHHRGSKCGGLPPATNWETQVTTAKQQAERFRGDKKSEASLAIAATRRIYFVFHPKYLCLENPREPPLPLGPERSPGPLSHGKVWRKDNIRCLGLWVWIGAEMPHGTATCCEGLLGFRLTTPRSCCCDRDCWTLETGRGGR